MNPYIPIFLAINPIDFTIYREANYMELEKVIVAKTHLNKDLMPESWIEL